MYQLFWQPIHVAMDERARSGDRLLWIVAPFVKVGALERLLESTRAISSLKLICRWCPGDLITGVSDLQVFDYLKSVGADLYVNQRVHMKLYAFESNIAIITSANLTLRGLGYAGLEMANIEIGCFVGLSATDWVNLYRVVRGSRLMTAELYEKYKDYVNANPARPQMPAEPDLLGPAKKYTLASLPATDSPEALAEFYFNPTAYQKQSEAIRRGFQDLATFDIPAGLSRDEFSKVLSAAFLQSAFVLEFVDFLRSKRSLRFGAVNTWIHDKCEDVPLPYRWEVKSSTHAFYNWLAYFVPQVKWDRPRHSQVIYWTGGLADENSASDMSS